MEYLANAMTELPAPNAPARMGPDEVPVATEALSSAALRVALDRIVLDSLPVGLAWLAGFYAIIAIAHLVALIHAGATARLSLESVCAFHSSCGPFASRSFR